MDISVVESHYYLDCFVARKDIGRSSLHPYLADKEIDRAFIIAVGSLFATSFFFDQNIRNFTQNEIYGGSNIFTEFLHGIGDKDPAFYGLLALHSTNVALQNDYYNETLLLALKSLFITQGITEGFKQSFRRARPRRSPNDPFNFGISGDSFFSGHSSGVWAYLTVIAGRYPSVKWVAYPLAGSVSLSRVYEDAHWMSDVLLGALVGYTVGRLTLRSNMKYADRVIILPYIEDGEKRVFIHVGF